MGIFNYFYTRKAKSSRAITYDERRSKSVPCFPEVLIYQRCDDVNSRIKDFSSRFFVPFLIRHTHQLLVSLFFLAGGAICRHGGGLRLISPTTVNCPSMTEEAVKKVQEERNRLQQVIYLPVRKRERRERRPKNSSKSKVPLITARKKQCNLVNFKQAYLANSPISEKQPKTFSNPLSKAVTKQANVSLLFPLLIARRRNPDCKRAIQS